MKLATLEAGGRDGTLVVVRATAARYAHGDARSRRRCRRALDDWDARRAGAARARRRSSSAARSTAQPLDVARARARRCRARTSGSTARRSSTTSILVRKARGAEPPPTLETDPLVYQGGSGVLLGPTRRHPAARSRPGASTSSREVCVVLGDTPHGHDAPPTRRTHVRLVMLANDSRCATCPRRAGQGLRLLPEQAGDGVLAVRGHARRARRRAGATAACTCRVRTTYNGDARRRLRRRPGDALLVLRSDRAHRARRARSPPARSSAAAPSRTRTARAASRASPSGG